MSPRSTPQTTFTTILLALLLLITACGEASASGSIAITGTYAAAGSPTVAATPPGSTAGTSSAPPATPAATAAPTATPAGSISLAFTGEVAGRVSTATRVTCGSAGSSDPDSSLVVRVDAPGPAAGEELELFISLGTEIPYSGPGVYDAVNASGEPELSFTVGDDNGQTRWSLAGTIEVVADGSIDVDADYSGPMSSTPNPAGGVPAVGNVSGTIDCPEPAP